ncbi:MAG: hypothetical protein ACYCX2_01235 [Christensenellales bacterium]
MIVCDRCGKPYESGTQVNFVAAEAKTGSRSFSAGGGIDFITYKNVQPFTVGICDACLTKEQKGTRVGLSIASSILIAIIPSLFLLFDGRSRFFWWQAIALLVASFLIPWLIYSLIIICRRKSEPLRVRYVRKNFKETIEGLVAKQFGGEYRYMTPREWQRLYKESQKWYNRWL